MGYDEARQLHERLNKQDDLLTDIRDVLREHLTRDEDLSPSLREMVALWRGSKIMAVIVTAIAGFAGAAWAGFIWVKDHLK